MRTLILLFTSLFITNNLSAQTYTPEWVGHIGNHGLGSLVIKAMHTDAQGNLYTAGTSQGTFDVDPSAAFNLVTSTSGTGDYLGFFVKYDSTGAYLDHFSFGGNARFVLVSDMAVDALGNIIIVGTFRDSVFFEPGNPIYGPSSAINVGFIAKYDPDFNFQWVSVMEQTATMGMEKVAVDANGNIAVGGNFFGTTDFEPGVGVTSLTSVNTDVFFGKYDPAGDLLWVKKGSSAVSDQMGDVTFDADGNYYVAANYQQDANIADVAYFSGPYDNFTCVTKFAPDGTYIWNKGIANSGTSNQMFTRAMAISPDGNVVFTGTFSGQQNFESGMYITTSSAGSLNLFLATLDGETGTGLWCEGIYGDASEGQSMVIDTDGNIYIGGRFGGDMGFNFNTGANAMVSIPSTAYNYFAASYTSIGDYRWANMVATTGTAVITQDLTGRVWLSGNMSGTVDFDNAFTQNNITVPTNTSFFNRYSATGALIEVNVLKGTGTTRENVNAVKITENNKVVVAGKFKGDVDFDLGPNDFTLSGTDTTAFIAQYDLDGNLEWAIRLTGLLNVTAMDVDATGNCYLTGYFTGVADFDPTAANTTLSAGATKAIFMAKYSPTGTLVFANGLNGAGTDESYDIKLDLEGNFVITGRFGGAMDFDPSSTGTFTLTNPQNLNYAFAAKYTAAGTFVHAWRFTAVVGQRISIDNANGIIIVGNLDGVANFELVGPTLLVYAVDGASDDDYFVARYDENGTCQWAFGLGSVNPDNSVIDIATDNFGNVFVMAYFGNGSFTDSVDVQPGSGVFNLHANKSILAKYSISGNLQWAYNTAVAGGPSQHHYYNLATDANGNLTYACRFNGTADLDFSPTGTYSISGDDAGLLIARYSPSGVFLNAQHYDQTDWMYPMDISIKGDKVAVGGYFNGNTWFDLPPGSGPFLSPYATGAWAGNGFVLVGEQSPYEEMITVSLPESEMSGAGAYPNPTTGRVSIDLSASGASQVTVVDALGRTVLSRTLTQTMSVIDLTGHAPGLYSFKVEGQDGRKRYGKILLVGE